MARPLRVEYEGACYHLLSRGDRRENIFRDDTDRQVFLDTLEQACTKTAWQVHAFCLMSNHFHLVVETPRPNLCAAMKWFLGTVTMRFNRRHKLSGHLFAGRYKSLIIDERDAAYLKTVCDYVHLNPVRAGLLTEEQCLATFFWSSFPLYLRAPSVRPVWLRADRVLGEHGIQRDDRLGRLEFARRMEITRRLDRQSSPEEQQAIVALRRGWRLGSEDFLARLLDRLEQKDRIPRSPSGSGQQRRESEQQRGERIVQALLAEKGWDEKRLASERKGHAVKVALAVRLRASTAWTQQQIADRLKMGTSSHLNHLLQRHPSISKAPMSKEKKRTVANT